MARHAVTDISDRLYYTVTDSDRLYYTVTVSDRLYYTVTDSDRISCTVMTESGATLRRREGRVMRR